LPSGLGNADIAQQRGQSARRTVIADFAHDIYTYVHWRAHSFRRPTVYRVIQKFGRFLSDHSTTTSKDNSMKLGTQSKGTSTIVMRMVKIIFKFQNLFSKI